MNRQLSTNSQVFYVFVDCMSIIFVTNDFTDKKLILTKCSLNKIVHELFKFEMYKPGVYSLELVLMKSPMIYIYFSLMFHGIYYFCCRNRSQCGNSRVTVVFDELISPSPG